MAAHRHFTTPYNQPQDSRASSAMIAVFRSLTILKPLGRNYGAATNNNNNNANHIYCRMILTARMSMGSHIVNLY